MTRWLPAALALLFAGTSSLAQEFRDHERAHGRLSRDDIFRRVDAYFVENLKERLDLTDEQLSQVLPRVRRLQGDRRALAQRRFRAMHEMRRILLSGTATEDAVQELLREVKAVEAEEPATVRRGMEAIDAVLSPVQQAKYRLIEVEVERRVRQALSHARGGGKARAGRDQRPTRPKQRPQR